MKKLISRIISRFLERTSMSVYIRNVANHNWGWFSNEDQRMHIQTVDQKSIKGPTKIRIWLETKGKRTFEVSTGNLSPSDLKKLRAEVESQRDYLEIQWSAFMITNKWVTINLIGSVITITAYPNSHNKFIRKLDLREEFPGAYYNGSGSWDRKKIFASLDAEHEAIAVGPQEEMDLRIHIRLDRILWSD
jgi:hypothetical protein